MKPVRVLILFDPMTGHLTCEASCPATELLALLEATKFNALTNMSKPPQVVTGEDGQPAQKRITAIPGLGRQVA